MMYLGDYAAGETIHFMWNSSDSNGASITRSTDGTVSVYKDNSDTQTTTGVTDSENVDSLTGVHRCVIATSDGFYTTATDFMVVLSAATIDTRVVNAVLAHFSIENRSTAAVKADTAAILVDTGTTLDGRIPAALTADGNIKADALRLGGTAQTGRDVGASVLLSAGSGAGQLDFTSGVVKANLAQILATALTETAGLLAGGFKKFFNVAAPTGTVNSLADAVPGAAGGGFIAGTNAATVVTTSLTTTFTGNVTGSVASVTGAVGSVTGLTASDVGAIKAKTDNLPTDPADESLIIAATDAIATLIGDVPTNAELATALGTADDAVLTAIGDLPTNAELATALGTADDAMLTAIGDLPTNAELATALGTADDAVLAAVAALNNLSAAAVNAEVVDALAVDTYAEPAQGAPAATTTLAVKIGYVYKFLRNKKTQTATTLSVFNDDAATVDHKATISDDGVTYVHGEVATGP